MSRGIFVVQIFLPLHDNEGADFPPELFTAVRSELAHRFGGVTAFMRSPAVGIWRDEEGVARRDDIVVFEAVTDALDRDWWRGYRAQLERTFRQEEILIRATASERL
jgi:hypothetical protein